MSKDFDEKKFDTRVIERQLKKGLLSRKDYDAYLKQLPNDEDNFEIVPIVDESTETASFTEDEIKSMPDMKPEDIENFDFLEKKTTKGKK
jgi:hypothetical protein